MSDPIPALEALPAGLRTLRAFREAHGCAVAACAAVAELTRGAERAPLADQVRRAAMSVYGNIAEGHAKPTRAEQARYYDMALASLVELQAHLAHAEARGLVPGDVTADVHRRARHTSRLLTGLRDAARRRAEAGRADGEPDTADRNSGPEQRTGHGGPERRTGHGGPERRMGTSGRGTADRMRRTE